MLGSVSGTTCSKEQGKLGNTGIYIIHFIHTSCIAQHRPRLLATKVAKSKGFASFPHTSIPFLRGPHRSYSLHFSTSFRSLCTFWLRRSDCSLMGGVHWTMLIPMAIWCRYTRCRMESEPRSMAVCGFCR